VTDRRSVCDAYRAVKSGITRGPDQSWQQHESQESMADNVCACDRERGT
jgi:hypothetical protein